MEKTILDAIKGKKNAWKRLYQNSKQSVWFILEKMLGDKEQAGTFLAVYRDLAEGLASSRVKTEEEFLELAESRALSAAKARIQRQNPKAYRIPGNRDFRIRATGNIAGGESLPDAVYAQFPPLHQLIFLMHAGLGMRADQMVKISKLDTKSLSESLLAERENAEHILEHQKIRDYSYDRMCADFAEERTASKVPEDAERAVLDLIAKIDGERSQTKKKAAFWTGALALALCLVIAGIVLLSGNGASETVSSGEDTGSSVDMDDTVIREPLFEFDPDADYYADIEIEGYGSVTVKLDPDVAPVTVSNFISLAESGFYDGLTFHRIMEGFMMQGGDPQGNGYGGSDRCIIGEFADNGIENTLSHTRGTISMARSAYDYNGASSQFFIMQEDYSYSLDGQYAAFGRVTEGMDVVDAVCEAAQPTDDNGTIPAEEQPVISSITIRRDMP